MFAIVGVVVVIGAIIGGYLLEKGNLTVLIQPAELLIIGGAALGTLLIANPLHILTGIISQLMRILKGSPYTKATYLDALNLLNDLFNLARKEGAAKLEKEIEEPEQLARREEIRQAMARGGPGITDADVGAEIERVRLWLALRNRTKGITPQAGTEAEPRANSGNERGGVQ